jgi:hypothetical protein
MLISGPCSVETLARCFLSQEEIPPAFRLGPCPEERLYLIDGQIRTWDRPIVAVRATSFKELSWEVSLFPSIRPVKFPTDA